MHKWTDEEVTRLTKVLVAGLCSSDADQDRSKCVRLFAAIADEIGADAWTFRTGMYLHDLQLPRVEWTDSQTSEIFDYDSNKMTLKMTLWADELAADLAHRMQTEEGEPWKPICSATQVFVFDSPTQWQTLVWVGMAANGQVGNLEFHRAPSAGHFSDFHRALVKMAAAQLMASLETIQPYTNCVDVLEQLPRRQREVLKSCNADCRPRALPQSSVSVVTRSTITSNRSTDASVYVVEWNCWQQSMANFALKWLRRFDNRPAHLLACACDVDSSDVRCLVCQRWGQPFGQIRGTHSSSYKNVTWRVICAKSG